jgi:hypothetical protein
MVVIKLVFLLIFLVRNFLISIKLEILVDIE